MLKIFLHSFVSVQIFFTFSMTADSESSKLKLDLATGFSHFEQQVKTKIGGEKGDILVADSEFHLYLAGRYPLNEWFSFGVFTSFDFGNRRAGQFSYFNSSNEPVVSNVNGGHFFEIWTGPLVHFKKQHWFAELGYAAFGRRKDSARSDLSSSGGGTTGFLHTSPTVAWMIALGSELDVSDSFSLLLRIAYRVRYYEKRSGEKLADNMVHGTQSLLPQIGVSFRL